MKITPLEIRQKTFEKEFRGYDKDEVSAFLTSLSQQWEKLIEESKELKIKLEASEKEVEKLREVESSLFKTLKTAEDTGANLIDQATKTAELHLKETQMNAEAVLSEAKNKAKEIMEEAEETAKKTLDDMDVELKDLTKSYRDLENLKNNLLDDLKGVVNDTLEKVKRAEEKSTKFDIDEFIKKSKLEILKNTSANKEKDKIIEKIEETEVNPPEMSEMDENEGDSQSLKEEEQEVHDTGKEGSQSKKKPGNSKDTSFFDEI